MRYPRGSFLTLLTLGALAAPAMAQDARFWNDVDARALPEGRTVFPARFRGLSLDVAGLRAFLASVPHESSQAAPTVLELPRPQGGSARFAVVESPIMAPALQAKFPGIRTYRGQGLTDRTATLRFDLTPFGFHAMVLSREGTVLIDPWQSGDSVHYLAYFKREHPRSGEAFRCDVQTAAPSDARADVVETLPNGDTLRTYRLAMAATGEYTVFHGGTVPAGMAAIVTAMNRVNEVYERDLAVRMELVSNNDLIVYTNGATDPYTNNNGGLMLGQNQTNLDTVIGSANYDIGHVFSTGGGGIAGLGVVCVNNQKAFGVTGLSNPIGDPFYIDYVAHEIGHQFDGNHSFNGTTSNCGGGNRNAATAWEPGSGSTIMSYAGICGAENLQPHSDDLFHVGNLVEMTNFIQAGAGSNCDAATPNGNSVPVVSGGSDFTLPQTTPFVLTATASDADGDSLTYNWEELDIGTAAPPNTDNGTRPIFRSFQSVDVPSRTLPRLQNILDGLPVPSFGEAWPTTNRTLNFRATVRDNRSGGGGVSTDGVVVTVTAGAGPFVVTQPDTAVIWTSGTTEAVSWSVANTDAPPVSCTFVDITLSTDGGNTFPITLAAATPNDGSETITVPAVSTTTARVKAQCATIPFLDIGNANFTIQPVPVELQQLTVE